MKFTMATILAAAVATVSSAVLQPLPAQFTLVFTSDSVALNKYDHDITIDKAYGAVFNMGGPGNEEQHHVTLVPMGDGEAWTTQGDWRFANPVTITLNGQVLIRLNPTLEIQPASFGQINGAFGVNGSIDKWVACPQFIADTWALYWNVSGCVPIKIYLAPV